MGGSSKAVVVGYKYYLGIHMALCYPVDEVQKITVADRAAWTGNAASGNITVNAPDLFGGEKKEGGVSGTINVLDGGSAQPVNAYLNSKITGNIPAFKGVLSLVLNQVYIGLNPYLKPWAFKVKRTNKLTNGNAQWYPAKSDISGDLNAIHIIREALTNSEWGMGHPDANIDDADFTVAADTLHAEGLGLSLLWNRTEKIEVFLEGITETIDAILYVSPSTGLWSITLIRADYTPIALPLFDASNTIDLVKYERVALGETTNEVSVIYRDGNDNKDKTVTVQDLGNIQMQGAVVAQKINYPGISNSSLAIRAAQRDLLARSTPLSRIDIKVNRQAWALAIGGVFRFSWPKLGLSEVVYRVGSVGTGTIDDGTIVITAIEDVFGLPTNSYAASQPTGWVDPTSPPAPVPFQQVVENTYWDVQTTITEADIAYFDPDFGFISTDATRAGGDSYGYELWSKVGGADYNLESSGASFTPTGTLTAAITPSDTSITLSDTVDLDLAVLNEYAYVGTEMVEVLTVDTIANVITVNRGLLDTVPSSHAIGVRVWFSGGHQENEGVERVDAEVVDVKLLPSTSQGTLAIGSATSMQVTLDNRYQRPYPPGNFKISATAYPAAPITTTNIDVTWAHRDKTQQLASFNLQSEGNIGPEAGVTYTCVFRGSGGGVLQTTSSITGTSDSYTPLVNDTITVEVYSTLGALNSMQMQSWSVIYAGF